MLDCVAFGEQRSS